MLKWKRPREYRSLTYNQSGFKLKNTSGRPVLWLSKIGEIPIHLHRDIPKNVTIKQVTVKREPTGEWYATFGIGVDEATAEKPENTEKVVGIDVRILKYAHDTDGYAIESPDFSDERERVERAQRDLSRKEHGSANWEKQRQVVAERHADLKRKRRDFLHKLSNYYAREYDLVAVEDLDAKGLVELPGNSRNRAGAAWGRSYECSNTSASAKGHTSSRLTRKIRRKSARPVVSRRTNRCGCANTRARRVGCEADRDANAAWNILSRGLEEVGVVHSESAPVETALPVDTPVSAKRVVESGSPTLKEAATAAE